MKIHQYNAGHMTKMVAMPIYGKCTLNLLSRNLWAEFDETFFMKHQRPKPFIICANYDAELNLTYFTALSNFAT